MGVALSRAEGFDFEIEWVVANHYGLTGSRVASAGAGPHSVGLSVGPWRIQIVVRGPGRIPRVRDSIIAVQPGK